ncbi:hypothetical protein T265_11171 [Opisthorchis viverrini]|uniref:Uncharacterized protein n=1 Tax=Opisthorchis viverrini TaxID=6198 RepID=A0A074YZN5_OPIVI|nr:hypothetical protein T265_11171 [Opisthorchis viverrini]KER20231.1 hypothetical protein T265_11171 [Opisthorchis viverrini]
MNGFAYLSHQHASVSSHNPGLSSIPRLCSEVAELFLYRDSEQQEDAPTNYQLSVEKDEVTEAIVQTSRLTGSRIPKLW